MTVPSPHGPQCMLINNGQRLHLSHGPIDLIIQADGNSANVRRAYAQATRRFDGLLEELVKELVQLRMPASLLHHQFSSPIARQMHCSVLKITKGFITPMAAVAGAVADEVLRCMTKGVTLDRAYVNNGGDIALYLGPDAHYSAGIVSNTCDPAVVAKACINSCDTVRGIATSGWQGRSHSLGIADAVTVLAETAAIADAAATLIANKVDLPGSEKIIRQPACELAPDSDLGAQMITTGVGKLNARETRTALTCGVQIARELCENRHITGAYLSLQGTTRLIDAQHEDVKLLTASM